MKTKLGKAATLLAILTVFIAAHQGFAQEPAANLTNGDEKQVERKMEKKELQTLAVMNLRQIGFALFEFENEYGEFPSERTAADVKKKAVTTAEVKAATANDCFFQLIAAEIAATARIFTFEKVAESWNGNGKMPDKLQRCDFAYLSGMTAAGNPARPLVVAPLVKGKKVFDPAVFGGKAVVLRVDNSVVSHPIDKDGRVMINGKDLLDPAQPYWGGKVPPVVRWAAD